MLGHIKKRFGHSYLSWEGQLSMEVQLSTGMQLGTIDLNKRSLRVRHVWYILMNECQTAPCRQLFPQMVVVKDCPGIPFLSVKTSGMLGFFVCSHWNLFILPSRFLSSISVQSLPYRFFNPSWYWSSWQFVQLIQQWCWKTETFWGSSFCQFHLDLSYVNCDLLTNLFY